MKVETKLEGPELTEFLQEKALTIRRDIIKMTGIAGSGHPGGSLSATDIVAAIYWYALRHDPNQPKWKERDRFILSKGHAAPVLYAALAETGYINRDVLWTLRQFGSALQGHPDMRKVAGVEISTGSLGQGLAIACGIALAGRLDKLDYKVYTVIGDGESQEGEIWEAAMLAAHYKLDNLIAITDYNDLQIDGRVSDIKDVCPVDDKWRAFGWHVICIDGHDMDQIVAALDEARQLKGKPVMIEAKTIKGKGVSFMEDMVEWHGVAPNQEQMIAALKELGVDDWTSW
ncbi:MAG: transketolase [Actinomycetota bacterium]|nr:transketolase [Actinomycetota bacterium]